MSMNILEVILIPLVSITVLLGLFLFWYKNPSDLPTKLLLTFPVVVGSLMIMEGPVWNITTGHSLFNIPASTGLMLMVTSCFTIPFAILRGTGK